MGNSILRDRFSQSYHFRRMFTGMNTIRVFGTQATPMSSRSRYALIAAGVHVCLHQRPRHWARYPDRFEVVR